VSLAAQNSKKSEEINIYEAKDYNELITKPAVSVASFVCTVGLLSTVVLNEVHAGVSLSVVVASTKQIHNSNMDNNSYGPQ